MHSPLDTADHVRTTAGDGTRQLLAGVAVRERRLDPAGIPTSVLVGGEGSPLLLLHGPGGSAVHFAWALPGLVAAHHVIVPDLPGHGVAGAADPPDAGRVLRWLDELITATCASPPALVGCALGGAIAARYAADHGDRISRLVLVDSLGLTPFAPAPEFGQALGAFIAQPTDTTHDALWAHCARDLDRLRDRLAKQWDTFRALNVERARRPETQAMLGRMMEDFGEPAIAPEDLDRIHVPTALIWGRDDRATPLAIAEAAGARHGWPLYVIEDSADDPPIEQPDAFVRALGAEG
jgi:pimeloyl-ACP methyl ester carboxylesterase